MLGLRSGDSLVDLSELAQTNLLPLCLLVDSYSSVIVGNALCCSVAPQPAPCTNVFFLCCRSQRQHVLRASVLAERRARLVIVRAALLQPSAILLRARRAAGTLLRSVI